MCTGQRVTNDLQMRDGVTIAYQGGLTTHLLAAEKTRAGLWVCHDGVAAAVVLEGLDSAATTYLGSRICDPLY